MKEKNTTPEMLTAADLQEMGFTRSMAYAFFKRDDVPVIQSGNLSAARNFMNGLKNKRERGIIYNGIGQRILREV